MRGNTVTRPMIRHKTPARTGVRFGALAILGSLLATQAARAQTTGTVPAQPRPSAPAEAMRPRGVIVPKPDVDPGMKVKAPSMPPQSTPVIHPKSAPGGNVIPR